MSTGCYFKQLQHIVQGWFKFTVISYYFIKHGLWFTEYNQGTKQENIIQGIAS